MSGGSVNPTKRKWRSRELTPGHPARQQAAVETPVRDLNPLTSDMVEPLTAHDVLSWMRPGIQHGVFRKLRLGQYPLKPGWTCTG